MKTTALYPHESMEFASLTVQFASPGYIVGLAPTVGAGAEGFFGAIAHVDSTIAVATQELIRQIIAIALPVQRLKIFAYHARALSRMIYDKIALLSMTIPDRIVHSLRELQRIFPARTPRRGIDLPLSHQDLAELVGASREHVMRSIAQLQTEGIVSIQDQRYIVRPVPTASRRPVVSSSTPVK